MRPYEVVIIIDAGLEDDAIQASVHRATGLLTERGATVNNVERWGKRRFAYELDHRWEGYYALVNVSSEPAAIADLERMLTLADEVLRHKVIRLPKEALAKTTRRPRGDTPSSATDPIGA
ncbi:MAG: 30S ribosomal protein S6 [Actinobacteria bacterium]|nr:30S ribosomal protein S6 [Actinomycetota bacterium]